MKNIELQIGDKFYSFKEGKDKVKKIKRFFKKVTIVFDNGEKIIYCGYPYSIKK